MQDQEPINVKLFFFYLIAAVHYIFNIITLNSAVYLLE